MASGCSRPRRPNVFSIPGRPRKWSAWKWLMKISSSSSSPTERSSWRWVPSPQSNSSRSPPPHLGRVDVAVHRRERRPDHLDLLERLERRKVARVEDQVSGGEPLHAPFRYPTRPSRQVGIRYHRDDHAGNAPQKEIASCAG